MNDNHRLLRQGLLLEYLTLGWNVIGSAVLGFAAIEGRSNALAGFALDSVIEIGASMAVIWQLRGVGADRQPRALKMIAWAFFAMAVYIAAQAAHGFVRGSHAGSSPMGAAWLTVTAVVMFALAAGKSRIGLLLGNEVLKAEGRVTMIDGMLALSVLTGLLLNTLAGCRWADPLASLVIVFYGVREGIHAWTASRKCVTTGVHR